MAPYQCHGKWTFSFSFGLLAMHFGIDAVARGVCQDFESLVEPFFFGVGNIRPRCQAFSFLDDNS